MEEQAQFTCEAFSFSKVSYKWERENGLLPDKANIDTCSSTLTIPNGTQFDEGNYCCVATNECGPVKECGILSVIGMNEMNVYSICTFLSVCLSVYLCLCLSLSLSLCLSLCLSLSLSLSYTHTRTHAHTHTHTHSHTYIFTQMNVKHPKFYLLYCKI